MEIENLKVQKHNNALGHGQAQLIGKNLCDFVWQKQKIKNVT